MLLTTHRNVRRLLIKEAMMIPKQTIEEVRRTGRRTARAWCEVKMELLLDLVRSVGNLNGC